MKKIATLCLLICSVLFVYPQGIGNITGALTGSSVTTAAANAVKQLQTIATIPGASATTGNSMSQLQLLGLDPTTIQKYLKSKADAAAAPQDQANPLQDILQTIFNIIFRTLFRIIFFLFLFLSLGISL